MSYVSELFVDLKKFCDIKPSTNDLYRDNYQYKWRDWTTDKTGSFYLSECISISIFFKMGALEAFPLKKRRAKRCKSLIF